MHSLMYCCRFPLQPKSCNYKPFIATKKACAGLPEATATNPVLRQTAFASHPLEKD